MQRTVRNLQICRVQLLEEAGTPHSAPLMSLLPDSWPLLCHALPPGPFHHVMALKVTVPQTGLKVPWMNTSSLILLRHVSQQWTLTHGVVVPASPGSTGRAISRALGQCPASAAQVSCDVGLPSASVSVSPLWTVTVNCAHLPVWVSLFGCMGLVVQFHLFRSWHSSIIEVSILHFIYQFLGLPLNLGILT